MANTTFIVDYMDAVFTKIQARGVILSPAMLDFPGFCFHTLYVWALLPRSLPDLALFLLYLYRVLHIPYSSRLRFVPIAPTATYASATRII